MINLKLDQDEQHLLIEALETTAMVYEDMKRDKRAERYYTLADKIRKEQVNDDCSGKIDFAVFMNQLE